MTAYTSHTVQLPESPGYVTGDTLTLGDGSQWRYHEARGWQPGPGVTVTAETNDLTGGIDYLTAGGIPVPLDGGRQSAPISDAYSWVGDSKPRLVELGFEGDLVLVKAPGQYAVMLARDYWYGNIQAFGHTALSGSDGAPGPSIQPNGLSLIGTQAAVNTSGNTYYAFAIRDNGAGILKTWAYNGFRDKTVGAPDNQGVTSNPVTMDLLAGTNPSVVHIKRDATGAGHEGVWATPTWAKKESAASVNNALLTLAAGGSMSLSTDIAVNENDGGIVGEGHNGFSLHNPGKYWDLLSYDADGTAKRIGVNGDVVCAILIPQAAQEMQFWIDGMGQLSADGGQTALHADRLWGGKGVLNIGTDASVNTPGTTYKVVVFYRSQAPEAKKPKCKRPWGVRISTTGSSRIACGTDASLAIAGAHSLEWVGSISDSTAEQFVMGRGGNATTGSRATPVAGSWNYGMSYTRDPDAGMEVCTSDQFSSESTNASKQKRWRTGVLVRAWEDYHQIITFDGTDKWIYYIDGRPVKWRRLPMSVFGLNSILATAGLTMSFGGRISANTWAAAGRTTHKFGRIYNRVLTAAEVAQMYARHYLCMPLADIADTGAATVEEWPFLDASGSTVTATKSSANNGTITGGVWVPGI